MCQTVLWAIVAQQKQEKLKRNAAEKQDQQTNGHRTVHTVTLGLLTQVDQTLRWHQNGKYNQISDEKSLKSIWGFPPLLPDTMV